jgi:hypothetical protein
VQSVSHAMLPSLWLPHCDVGSVVAGAIGLVGDLSFVVVGVIASVLDQLCRYLEQLGEHWTLSAF